MILKKAPRGSTTSIPEKIDPWAPETCSSTAK